MEKQMAHVPIEGKEIVVSRRVWQEGSLTIPGIGVALLPKLACPFCWPLYSGIVSSVGLGFLISTKYLLTPTITCLMIALGPWPTMRNKGEGIGPSCWACPDGLWEAAFDWSMAAFFWFLY